MKKKVIIAAAALVAIIGITAVTIWYMQSPEDGQTAQNTTCAVDITALIIKDDKETLKTDEDIVRALFANYFDGYKKIPDCTTAGIKNHNLTSVGKITRENDHIFADIVFDLEPISITETEWDTPETTVEGGWIKGKKGTLSIQKAEDTWYLVL